MKRLQSICRLIALFGLYGCTVGPDYVRPAPPLPEKWQASPEVKSAASSDYQQWWKSFNDPILNELIVQASTANLDFQAAQARIRDSRSQYTMTRASGLPSLSAHNSTNRRLNNINTPSVGNTSSQGGGGFGVGNQIINIFQTGLDAQWEIDLFGGSRRAIEAAEATVEASIENSRAILVSLLGEVALNYLQLRSNQQALLISRENIDNLSETLNLTRVRHQAGLASQLETAQTEILLANTQAQLPLYQQACQLNIHALGVLLGEEPGKLSEKLQQAAPLPATANPAQADMPSELLLRRPDIRRAERQLAAANAQIGVAMAAQYPRFNLTAFLGLQNSNISDLTPISKSWSLASSLSLPIFNWGSVQANIESKESLHEQALLAYRSSLLTAFKEVEDALVSSGEQRKRRLALQQAQTAAQLSMSLTKELYGKGLSTFLDVLSAERALFQIRRDILQSDTEIAAQSIALYKALGGGWQTPEHEPETLD